MNRLTHISQYLWPLALASGFFLFGHPFLSPPDCAFYWAWGESIFRYGTLDFAAVYEKFQVPLYYCSITETARLSNDWPVGSGLIIGPWSLLPPEYAHAWLLWLLAVAFAAWYHWTPESTSPETRLAAIAATLLATPMLFYALFGPFFSHLASFVVVTLFIVLWARCRLSADWRPWTLLGVLLGLAFVVRPQNLLLAVVFLADLPALFRMHRAALSRPFRLVAALAAGAIIGALPRYLPYAVLYGSPIALPKAEEMQWFSPQIAGVLFSDFHGVLPWTPGVFLGFLGLLLLARRQRGIAVGLCLAYTAQVYVNAANEVWWSGGSFGNRRLADYSIVCCFGFAALFAAPSRAIRLTAILATILCCAWTTLLILAERRLLLPLFRYVAFDSPEFRQALRDTLTQPAATWASITSHVKENTIHRALAAALFAAATFGLTRFCTTRNAHPNPNSDTCISRLNSWLAGAVITCIILTLPAAIAALRTPPQTDPGITSRLGRTNAILYDNYLELANYRLARNQPDLALAAARKGTAVRPDHYSSYTYQGMALFQMNRFAEAADNFQRVLDFYPEHPTAPQMLQQSRTNAWLQGVP